MSRTPLGEDQHSPAPLAYLSLSGSPPMLPHKGGGMLDDLASAQDVVLRK